MSLYVNPYPLTISNVRMGRPRYPGDRPPGVDCRGSWAGGGRVLSFEAASKQLRNPELVATNCRTANKTGTQI